MFNPRLTIGILFLCCFCCSARTTVFWELPFPSIGSRPVPEGTLSSALGSDVAFSSDLGSLKFPDTDLLVLPYGSAFPEQQWDAITGYLHSGGNLLVIGGQPFRIPVARDGQKFVARPPQDRFSRQIGVLHTYEAPERGATHFVWKSEAGFPPGPKLRPEHTFVLEGRGINGLGYLVNDAGDRVAAPIVVLNHWGGETLGSRYVFLDFQPAAGFWESADGVSIIRTAAQYARAGAVQFRVDLLFSTIRTGEPPLASVHVRGTGAGEVTLELMSEDRVVDTRRFPVTAGRLDTGTSFGNNLTPGFYRLRALYRPEDGMPEAYENGFWVADEKAVHEGSALGVQGDILTLDGKPFFPAGTNYFSTESNGWDFSGARNAAIWEQDFADMERHNVTFVRTGVWNGQARFTESGNVTERFLRNVEAYLLCAQRHHIAVNFTFFAFDPQSTTRLGEDNPVLSLPGSNPYLDPVTVRAEQSYLLSIVERFKDVPYLCWDLINEPSFSNPHALWHGNVPSNDPAEQRAWHTWLHAHYSTPDALARAWSAAPDQIKDFDSVPIPMTASLGPDLEHGDQNMIRATDYNHFAQDSFASWVKQMVDAIRETGSKQLIDVGQDEGGVQNRVLNQFYAHSGLAFTTNHTYRENQNLLWDSFASKAPGVANIVGETGYQPVTYPNGDWHFDELTGFPLIEAKWTAGFAAGTTGFLSWDWDREIYFGLERSDGSAKTWEDLMRSMGEFAKTAAPYATSLVNPDIAIVLPQSLQLSVLNRWSLEAQQQGLRALYGYAHGAAYAVGEDQLEFLGHPKLIILPSPWVIDSHAWMQLLEAVRGGATLLVSGRFDLDDHFLPTGRRTEMGFDFSTQLLDARRNQFAWPGGKADLVYSQSLTDLLQKTVLPDGKTFTAQAIGGGKMLIATLPLELNDNLEAVGAFYRYAMQVAGVHPIYTTQQTDPAILISPTQYPHATLYVLTSQSDRNAEPISFRDIRSGHTFSGSLNPGRSALLLVAEDGRLVTSYNWH